MHPLQLTLAVADLPSISSYPGALFLSTLGVDPTELSTYVVVLVLEYAGVCGLAVAALWLRMAALKRGGVAG